MSQRPAPRPCETGGVAIWVDLVAEVECRSEGQAEERPVAVRVGGERIPVRRLLGDATVGPAVAGATCERRLTVELENGDRLELRQRLPDGEWRVRRLQGR